ncbi:MAG: hemagglutinin-related protein [Parcubacteria group bacterium Gr01-1014_3]|nr:MAG: hemagglutinin-related protein [Parcubacteria group bacterium Gr01-1014_3]
MADLNPAKPKTPDQSASDRLVKKDNRRLTWTIVGLITVVTLLLLCILPGSPALAVLLKLPEKAQPVITKLESISFDPVGPSSGSGGGSSSVEFPVGSSIIVNVPPDLTRPRPTPTPPRRWPDCVRPVIGITTATTEIEECPDSSIPKPPPPPPTPVPGEPKKPAVFDFGDAPDKPKGGFPSLLSSSGARHFDVSRFYLGKRVDVEGDSKQVDADSATPPAGVGPDDGLNITLSLGVGAAGTALVDGIAEIHNNNWPEEKPIYLNALYDFNNNLQWDIPGEHVVTDYELHIPPGESVYGNIISLSANRLNWLRATVSEIPLGLGYNGSWSKAFDFGETEDYFKPEIYPIHIVKGSHFVFTSEDREHKWGPSQIHITGPTYGVPVETGGGRPKDPGPATIDMTKPTPAKPGTDVPTFDPRLFTHEGATTRLTPRKPGSNVDPNPTSLIITLPTQRGGLSVVNIFPIPDFLTSAITQIQIRNLERTLFHLEQLADRPITRIRTVQKEIEVLKEVIKLVPTPTTPIGGITAPAQYKIEVIGIDTGKGTMDIQAYGFVSGNNEVEILEYSANGQLLNKTSKPFNTASFRFEFKSFSGAVSIVMRLVHNGDVVPGTSINVPSVATITGGLSGAGPQCQYTISLDDTLADGTANTAYSQTVTATGGSGSYTYAVTAGSLPTGLTLASNGTITGTPTTAATYAFTITATDVSGCTASRAYSVTIASACPTVSFSPTDFVDGQDGRASDTSVAGTLTSSTGTGSNQALNMPPGVDVNISGSGTGVITWNILGTPIGVGDYSFTARIAVAGCSNLDTPFTWTVTP